MERARFSLPQLSDNVAVKQVTRVGNVRKDDVLTSDVSVSFTVTDFNNNQDSCSINIQAFSKRAN